LLECIIPNIYKQIRECENDIKINVKRIYRMTESIILITTDDIDYVLANSPENITSDDARKALEDTENNRVEAIALIWKIEKPAEKPKTKYDEMREICDAYEVEMDKFMKQGRMNNAATAAIQNGTLEIVNE